MIASISKTQAFLALERKYVYYDFDIFEGL